MSKFPVSTVLSDVPVDVSHHGIAIGAKNCVGVALELENKGSSATLSKCVYEIETLQSNGHISFQGTIIFNSCKNA